MTGEAIVREDWANIAIKPNDLFSAQHVVTAQQLDYENYTQCRWQNFPPHPIKIATLVVHETFQAFADEERTRPLQIRISCILPSRLQKAGVSGKQLLTNWHPIRRFAARLGS